MLLDASISTSHPFPHLLISSPPHSLTLPSEFHVIRSYGMLRILGPSDLGALVFVVPLGYICNEYLHSLFQEDT